jgi:hypothetical protein
MQKRRGVFPKAVDGNISAAFKWASWSVTLAVYYMTPWLRWDRGPMRPTRRCWSTWRTGASISSSSKSGRTNSIIVAGLLIMAAIGLFLMTSRSAAHLVRLCLPANGVDRPVPACRTLGRGRPQCPHQGSTRPVDLSKHFGQRLLKHGHLADDRGRTGGAWIFYFADAPTLVAQNLATFQAPLRRLFDRIGVLTLTTFVFGGFMREQVCIYMCPWPRIQAAMLDENR